MIGATHGPSGYKTLESKLTGELAIDPTAAILLSEVTPQIAATNQKIGASRLRKNFTASSAEN